MTERVTIASLAELSCWVAWQVEKPEGRKETKIPYSPERGKAKADNPATWGTRAAAQARAASLPMPFGLGGTGIEFCPLPDGRSLGGVDLDACRDKATGAIEPWASAIIEGFASYAEVSPSGTGVKVFFLFSTAAHDTIRKALGTGAGGKLKWGSSWSRRTGADHPPAIELHTGNRYFAVTDQILEGGTDELREVPVAEVLHLIRVTGPAFPAAKEAADDDAEADAAIAAQEAGPTPQNTRKRNLVGQDQSRSVNAFRVGAKARRDGADYQEMCRAIAEHPDTAEWYREKGEADGGRELKRIWEKVNPYEGDLILSRTAPLGSARQFIGRKHLLHGDGGPWRTLHHQNGTFYLWQGAAYAEREPEEMRAEIYDFLDRASTYSGEEVVAFDPNKNRVANVIEALAAEAQLPHGSRPPAWLAGAPSGAPDPATIISCQNGLLDLATRKLHPHTPTLFSLNALPFDYLPNPPPPAEWLGFLNTLWADDPDAQNAVQEFFGLTLTADTSHQKAFLIVGPKRSGKGTIARILTEMLGAANVCSPTLSSLATNFGLSPLIGKRLAIISDARLSGKADQATIAERLLAITGEDGQTIDRKYRDPWTGKLDARFLVLTNELPRLTDSSGALASRFIILVLTRSFYGQEDMGLLDKLRPELPGILHWSLAGLNRLRARGRFLPPASAEAAVREMEDLGSPIGAFLRDRCEVRQGASVPCGVLYATWREWCTEQGREHPGSAQTFGRDLAAAVAGLKVSNLRAGSGAIDRRERHYEGVALVAVERSGTRSEALCSQLPDDTYFHGDPGPSHPQAQWHR